MRKVSLYLLILSLPIFASNRSFVDDAKGDNYAVLVGASHGLPGIDIDVETVRNILDMKEYDFDMDILEEDEASFENVSASLTRAATNVGKKGSLFFYFSGHGNKGSVYLDDSHHLTATEMRTALEAGRKGMGPIERLMFVFDSCYSGSFLDILRMGFEIKMPVDTADFVDSFISELTPSSREAAYWKKLFVFASSKADETSMAGQEGSHFTLAFKKGFEEALASKGTMRQFVDLATLYTTKHHPVAKLTPEMLWQEPLAGN